MYVYGWNDFTSDIGGLSGLFLGVSFWSIWVAAKDCLFPLLGRCFGFSRNK